LSGVRTTAVVRGELSPLLRGVGTIAYDETRLTDVNLKVDGWIRELHVNYVGQQVHKGQALFTLYSQELMGAQLQYLAALRARAQLTPAQAADREPQERLIETPKARLTYLDFPEDQLRIVEKTGEAIDAVAFRSPATGVVVEKSVAKGMHVEAGKTLYRLADNSRLWLEADFNPNEATSLKSTEQLRVLLGGQPTRSVNGRIVHIFPSLAGPSKSVRARIELANSNNDLKPGMFATVEVTGPPSQGLIVPEDAVIDSGRQQIVFVATGNGRFEPRTVTLGLHRDDRFIVLSGVTEGEQVVTRAAFLIDSESQLQAAIDGYRGSVATGQVTGSVPVTVRLMTDPNPARAGENKLEVQLLDEQAKPVTDASIDVKLYMAAMPSMNMPAMQAAARLNHAGNGIYRGTGTFSMAGSWDVTLSISRRGHPAFEKQMSILVR
jgi:RND family efflux transporter MFP subunit